MAQPLWGGCAVFLLFLLEILVRSAADASSAAQMAWLEGLEVHKGDGCWRNRLSLAVCVLGHFKRWLKESHCGLSLRTTNSELT